MQNKVEVLKRLLALCEYFKENLSESVQEVYLTALSRYDDEQIFKAFEQCYFMKFFPRLHAIKEIIEGTEEDKAQEVWQYVLSEIVSKGVDRVKFDDATMRAIQACGGIRAIGHCDINKLSFKEKDFVNNYKVSVKSKGLNQLDEKRLKELTKGIG